MARSSSLVERPILRMLLLGLMGLALASRLALGATLPAPGSANIAASTGALAKLQAAMVMCHQGHGHEPAPTAPRAPLAGDPLLFDQTDNAHALASDPVVAAAAKRPSAEVVYLAVHAEYRPPLRPPVRQARGPPAQA